MNLHITRDGGYCNISSKPGCDLSLVVRKQVFGVTAKLICVFVFAYAKKLVFSQRGSFVLFFCLISDHFSHGVFPRQHNQYIVYTATTTGQCTIQYHICCAGMA